ncbi:MAG TPA: AI-2E family transporter [Polyangiaceae bacterium]|jgi:predicted PurR-regulated permease PerM
MFPSILTHRSKRSQVVFLAIWGTIAVAAILFAQEILLPFILGLVVAYVLTPAVRWVETFRVPRWGAVLLVYFLTIGGSYASLAAMAPRLGSELRGLLRELPNIAAVLQNEKIPAFRQWLSGLTGITPPTDAPAPAPGPVAIVPKPDGSYEINLGTGLEVRQFGEGRWRIEPTPPATGAFEPSRMVSEAIARSFSYVQRNTIEVFRMGRSIVTAVSRAIFVFFMTLMIGAYIMMTRERVVGFFRSLVFPESRRSFDVLLARIDRGLSGVVRGQLLICVVNGVLSAVGFWLFGLKYWPILAILACVMSVVPIFGSILSSIPIVALALTQSVGLAAEVLLWIVGIHQLEANLLNPKIIGDQAHIHPVLVVFSLLVGEHFFGVPGAILAVPVLSIAQSFFLHFRIITFGDDAPADSFVPPPTSFAPAPSTQRAESSTPP